MTGAEKRLDEPRVHVVISLCPSLLLVIWPIHQDFAPTWKALDDATLESIIDTTSLAVEFYETI